jgi:hypothetical protein
MRFPNKRMRFIPARILAPRDISAGVNMADPSFEFSLGEKSLTRFPPNVEQITVERESLRTWLITRRNDVILRFPLTDDDCQHLAALLTQGRP